MWMIPVLAVEWLTAASVFVDVRDFHPMVQGGCWQYEVQETDRLLIQSIRVEPGRDVTGVMLASDSGMRHTRYHIEMRDDGCYLDEIQGRWGPLPIWRSHRIEPPLPFLRVSAKSNWSWAWLGTAEMAGEEVVRADFEGRHSPTGPDGERADERWVVVEARFLTRSGETVGYEAWYEKNVGLVRQTTNGYEKRLQRYVAP
jgi:hypothetical protein